MPEFYSRITGTGSFLPAKIVMNFDLMQSVDTSDEWIVQRTGIKKRHLTSEGESTTMMAVEAAKIALQECEIDPASVQAIIVATCTPDMTLPSCASLVQAQLQCVNACAFDIQAACSGFIHALSIGHSLILANKYKRVLVIGADSMSKIVDWTDRNTCILFGDGAGAVILERSNKAGIMDFHLLSDGRLSDKLFTTGGVASTQSAGTIKMDGKSIFQNAIMKMSESIQELLLKNNVNIKDVDAVIPHQANIRIIEALADKLGFDRAKIVSTIAEHANTSAASIPLALDFQIRSGKLKDGDLVILAGVGAGLNWGSAIVRL